MSKQKQKKKNKTQSSTMEQDYGYYYRNSELLFDKTDYEISSILLELSNPVVIFPSDSPFLHKWGRKRKRSSSGFLKSPVVSPVPVMIKSPPCNEVGSTSSSSCLTGEAKKTIPQTIKNGLEEEFSTKNHQKISSQSNSVLEEDGLIGAQVGLLAQPISVTYQNLSYLQPLMVPDRTVDMKDLETAPFLARGNKNMFDLNLPVPEEGNHFTTMVNFQSVTTNVQAAAQARQRRLGLIRSKRFCSRFISPYQYK